MIGQFKPVSFVYFSLPVSVFMEYHTLRVKLRCWKVRHCRSFAFICCHQVGQMRGFTHCPFQVLFLPSHWSDHKILQLNLTLRLTALGYYLTCSLIEVFLATLSQPSTQYYSSLHKKVHHVLWRQLWKSCEQKWYFGPSLFPFFSDNMLKLNNMQNFLQISKYYLNLQLQLIWFVLTICNKIEELRSRIMSAWVKLSYFNHSKNLLPYFMSVSQRSVLTYICMLLV